MFIDAHVLNTRCPHFLLKFPEHQHIVGLGFLATGEAGLEEERPWTAELPENAAMDGQDESSTDA
jgi:hypothetical protein